MFRLINSHLQAYSVQVKNRSEDNHLLVETYSLHITLCNKNSCADVKISIQSIFASLCPLFNSFVMHKYKV